MTSSIDIANFALSHLGAGRITSFADPSEEAILCNLFYNTTRRKCLTTFPWSFARKRASLAASASAPAFRYTNAYPLPADFLHLMQAGEYYPAYNYDTVINNETAIYIIEDGEILTDLDAPLKIRYIYDKEDSATFPATFVKYLYLSLAVALSEKITQSTTKRELLLKEEKMAHKEAVIHDRRQSPPQEMAAGSFMDSRVNYYGGF